MGYIEFENVSKVFNHRGREIVALDGAEFFVKEGEFCVLTGPSGSGKTTILNILAGMDTVTDGKVIVDGQEISAYDECALEEYRRMDVGYILSSGNLIPTLTVIENIELAARLTSRPFDPKRALENVDLTEVANHFPDQLTRPQKQKAAIARAMVKQAAMLLLDEPMEHLSCAEGKDVLTVLYEISRETGKTVLLATQNEAVTGMADRIIRVRDGRVQRKYLNKKVKEIEELIW